MLREMAERGERAKGGGDLKKELRPATLSDFGITKTQSHRWQKVAKVRHVFLIFVAAITRSSDISSLRQAAFIVSTTASR
jgi:hypothetical protein